LDAAAHLQPAQPGQYQVEDHQIGALPTVQLQRLFAVRGREHGVTFAPQVQAHDLPDVRLVVYDQDLRHPSFRSPTFS
jgi:hypothetical protein